MKKTKSMLPWSLRFFVVAGAVFLLQVFPYTGIFLMFLIAPYWSVALVNLGFLGVALEGAAGRVPRGWLIMPIVWFGGYAAFAAFDYRALAQLRFEVAAANAPVRIPFDPDRQALVLERSGDVDGFVTDHALPVIYALRAGNRGSRHQATRMVEKAVCDRGRGDPSWEAAGIFTMGFHDQDLWGRGSRLENRFCVLHMPEDPALPAVTVSTASREELAGLLPIRRTTTTVTMPEGSSYVLQGGFAHPLHWLPMPLLGCWLNSGAASWNCTAQFYRDRFMPISATDAGQYAGHADRAVLARALGLVPVNPADRRGPHIGIILATIERVRRRVLDTETFKLDQVLADVSADVGSVPFNSLRLNRDIVLPRLAAIIASIERGIEVRGNGRNNAQQLFRLIQQLPPDALEPFRAQVDAWRGRDGWFVLGR